MADPLLSDRLTPPAIRGRLRKYSFAQIDHAVALAVDLGNTWRAAKETNIPYYTLLRLVKAYRRRHATLEEVCAGLTHRNMVKHQDVVEQWRLNLRLQTEAAKEGIEIARRTGMPRNVCIRQAAQKRGLKGETVIKALRWGQLPGLHG